MERAAKILGGFKERDNPLHHVHSLTNIETFLFIYKNKFYKNNEAEIGKKKNENKVRTFSGWEVQEKLKWLWFIFFKKSTKEWPEHRQTQE